MNTKQAVDAFLLAIEADGLKPKTIIWYRYIVANTFAAQIGTRPLRTVTTNQIRQHIVDLRKCLYSEDTIHGHTRALHRFWRWCANEYKMVNPMANIKYPSTPKPKLPKAVSVHDIVRLLEICGDDRLGIRDKAMFAFLADTGCRAAGICGLTMTDLELERGRAYVREKGDKTRAVYITETTIALMERWIEARDQSLTLFHNNKGAPMTSNGLLQMHYRRAEAAGVRGRVNPHSFRHGFAREYLRNGGDLATLSRILGHTSVEVTAAFYGVFTEDELGSIHQLHTPMNQIKRVMKTG